MLNDLFQPMHLLIIGLGEGLKGFKEGLKGVTDDAKSDAHIVTPEPKEPLVK